MILFEAGVIDFLRSENFNFSDKYQDKLTSDEKRYIYNEIKKSYVNGKARNIDIDSKKTCEKF